MVDVSLEPTALFGVQDKGFLVVGAGQGLGAAVARVLAAGGARLVCVDLDPDLAAAIAREVEGLPIRADVTKEADVLAATEEAIDHLGKVDGLVDVVGGALFKPISQFTLSDWDQQFERNLRHAFLFGREIGGHQASRGGGSIVFISSVGAFYGGRLHPAYGAAKAALLAWMKALAQEYGPAGVRVNAIAPGATYTPRNAARWNAETEQETKNASLLGAIGEDWQIGAAALYLSSPAAGFITAHCLVADGGTIALEPYLSQGDGYDRIAADPALGDSMLGNRGEPA